MQQELICQGGVQVNTASVTGGGESVSVDLPNGPKPGTIWIVDVVGFIFTDTSQLDDFPPQICGIYMVPISTPPPSGTDSDVSISIAARGLPLVAPPTTSTIGFGIGTMVFGQLSATGPFIIPAGYTVRAVLSCGTGAPFAGEVQINLYAQLRILTQN